MSPLYQFPSRISDDNRQATTETKEQVPEGHRNDSLHAIVTLTNVGWEDKEANSEDGTAVGAVLRGSSDSSLNADDRNGNTDMLSSNLQVSSRETRSRRRQATVSVPGADVLLETSQKNEDVPFFPSIMTETTLGEATLATLPSKRKLTGAAKTSVQNKKNQSVNHNSDAIPVNNLQPGKTNTGKPSITNSSKNEECVKIKLLTGTLYLYRGRNRRAEFIRRV